MVMISRKAYAEIYGPTKGDVFRLGDTGLLAEIEHDFAVPGDELTTGARKSMRDGGAPLGEGIALNSAILK
jgi:urease subunit alpha